MALDNLSFELNGILLKHQTMMSKGNVFKRMSIKVADEYDIGRVVDGLTSWAGMSALGNLKNMVPSNSDDIPWPKLPIPLMDYDLYFSMSFGNDINSGTPGMPVDCRLVSLNFTRKIDKEGRAHLECLFNFDKCQEDYDNRLDASFLQYKEEDPMTGKKQFKLFNITLLQREPFTIGSAPAESVD